RVHRATFAVSEPNPPRSKTAEKNSIAASVESLQNSGAMSSLPFEIVCLEIAIPIPALVASLRNFLSFESSMTPPACDIQLRTFSRTVSLFQARALPDSIPIVLKRKGLHLSRQNFLPCRLSEGILRRRLNSVQRDISSASITE